MGKLITKPVWGKQNELVPGATSRVSVPLTLQLNGRDVKWSEAGPPQLYGPGDVVAIDSREIIRTGPLPLTPDYAPEKFAFIEFDRPDFPWMFTPAAPDTTEKIIAGKKQKEDCLRPWIVLLVVQKSLATITAATSNTLPVLSCPVSELPSLNESWAWAHAQYVGDLNGNSIDTKLDLDPLDRNLSRLLCPRKLAPHTSYVACLVPAFEAGRKAGLEKQLCPDFEADTEPLAHWQFKTNDEVKLPVYYSWEFSTGEQDRFIELAKKLQPLTTEELHATQSGIVRDMDLHDPRNGMETYAGAKTPILSALRIIGVSKTPAYIPPQFTDRLKDLLLSTPVTAKQVIPPPLYGSWHAPPGEVAAQLDSHPWLRTLNLEDPGYRVAAALGTQVIQREQEHLVAAAWENVEDLQRVNEYLVRKDLARCVTRSVHAKRLAQLSPQAFAQITERLIVTGRQGRGRADRSEARTEETTLQDTATSPEFRRMTRAVGPWAIKAQFAGYDLERIAPPPGGTQGARQVSGYKVTSAPNAGGVPTRMAADAEAKRLFKDGLLTDTDPQQTFAQEIEIRVGIPKNGRFYKRGTFGPVTYAPSFPQPMYEPLRDQFADMLLPGLDKIPNDRAAVLETNAQFIEAYMVGLNHEMSREFLWREFRTLLHTTYFQRFWDARGAEDPEKLDIPPIREWANPLGGNLAKGRGASLFFLLIRGELVVRFPNAMIYVESATPERKDPVLRISPVAGVLLLGFHLTNVAGWEFYVEEHFTEPFFGPSPKGHVADHTYVSVWQTDENGKPLYIDKDCENAACVADKMLQDRYRWEIRVTPPLRLSRRD